MSDETRPIPFSSLHGGQRPPITEVLKAADAREAAAVAEADRKQRAMTDAAIEKLREDETVIRAAAMNMLFVRAQQVGRSYVTPTDVRRFDIVVQAMMREPAKHETFGAGAAEQIAPQVVENDRAPELLRRIEEEIQQEG